MSLEDYQAMETTHYLLSNPDNATNLRKAMADLERGQGYRIRSNRSRKSARAGNEGRLGAWRTCRLPQLAAHRGSQNRQTRLTA